MKQEVRTMKRVTFFFVIIELFLYGSFLAMDLLEVGSNQISINLKFISILFCFFYTIRLWILRQDRSQWIRFSFLFLILSDYFLLIRDSYTLGVCTFLGVQLCYLKFLLEGESKFNRWKILRVVGRNLLISGSCLLVLHLNGVEMDETLMLATVYMTTFVGNLILAFVKRRSTKERYVTLFFLGLMLYFLCDINVAIFNLGDYVDTTGVFMGKLYQFATVAMWMFYLPGIVLITLSNDQKIGTSRGQ